MHLTMNIPLYHCTDVECIQRADESLRVKARLILTSVQLNQELFTNKTRRLSAVTIRTLDRWFPPGFTDACPGAFPAAVRLEVCWLVSDSRLLLSMVSGQESPSELNELSPVGNVLVKNGNADTYQAFRSRISRFVVMAFLEEARGITPDERRRRREELQYTCPICLERRVHRPDTFHDTLGVTCTHLFCKVCESAMRERRTQVCPICRARRVNTSP